MGVKQAVPAVCGPEVLDEFESLRRELESADLVPYVILANVARDRQLYCQNLGVDTSAVDAITEDPRFTSLMFLFTNQYMCKPLPWEEAYAVLAGAVEYLHQEFKQLPRVKLEGRSHSWFEGYVQGMVETVGSRSYDKKTTFLEKARQTVIPFVDDYFSKARDLSEYHEIGLLNAMVKDAVGHIVNEPGLVDTQLDKDQ